MDQALKIRQKVDAYKRFESTAGIFMAAIAVSFFKNNFRLQGFQDGSLKEWPKSEWTGTRKRLIKSGNLRRSIRRLSASGPKSSVGTDLPYARIQNDGGVIPITPKMRKFFWAMFYKTGLQQWKGLAMRQEPIKIPASPFIGDSIDLTRIMKVELTKALNKQLL